MIPFSKTARSCGARILEAAATAMLPLTTMGWGLLVLDVYRIINLPLEEIVSVLSGFSSL